MKKSILAVSSLLLSACLGMPDSITPVSNFDLQRYLGKWYEIARLDHSFERGLQRVTAEYALRDDGGISVLNRGYSANDGEWKQAQGKAYPVGDVAQGYLKVSFFGPFYGSYVIFELDPEYRHAFVSGPNRSYLWLLSRTPRVEPAVVERFVDEARRLGFDTDELVFVEQSA
jgi:apolipoprotein D and lipocalin family protein